MPSWAGRPITAAPGNVILQIRHNGHGIYYILKGKTLNIIHGIWRISREAAGRFSDFDLFHHGREETSGNLVSEL
jgi:hypothetical protein